MVLVQDGLGFGRVVEGVRLVLVNGMFLRLVSLPRVHRAPLRVGKILGFVNRCDV